MMAPVAKMKPNAFLMGACLWVLLGHGSVCTAALTKYFYFCSLSSQRTVKLNATVLENGAVQYSRIASSNNVRQLLENTIENDKSERSFVRGGASVSDIDNDNGIHEQSGSFQVDDVGEEEIKNQFDNESPALRWMAEEDEDTMVDGKFVGFQTENPPGTWQILEVRECPCSPHAAYGGREAFYCETNRGYCAVPGAYYSRPSDPVCLNIHNDEVFVRSVWPIIMIWFALTFTFCMCTWSGRNATDFLIATCFPSWNKYIFDAVCDSTPRRSRRRRGHGLDGEDLDPTNNSQQQDRNPAAEDSPREDSTATITNNNTSNRGTNAAERRNQTFMEGIVYRRRSNFQDRYRGIVLRARINEEGVAPDGGFEYEIRTRSFKNEEQQQKNGNLSEQNTENVETPQIEASNENTEEDDVNVVDGNDDDEDMGSACAICFLPLEDGDRVGEIECQHVFHVDCLKGWLTRRNVCPLCMQEGVAKPKGALRNGAASTSLNDTRITSRELRRHQEQQQHYYLDGW